MSAFKESTLIEKLSSTNYATWAFKMEMFLTKENLFDVITNDPPDPITTDWQKRDKKARAFINLFIEDNQIINVKGKETSLETWQALKTLHERRNLSSKLFLLRKLYSTKLQEGGNMINHVTKILETVDKLKAIGEEIKDTHVAALFLCSLPDSYNTLITALEARPENELTSDFIRSKLIDEFNRRIEYNNTPSGNVTQAFKTRKNYSNNLNHRRVNKFCTYCKKNSHVISECWHLKNKQASTSSANNNRGTKNKQYSSSSLCIQSNERKTKNDDIAFLAQKTNMPAWIIDSGSSSHITNCKDIFTEFIDSETSNVIIANGKKLTAYGSGNVIIKTVTDEGETNNVKLKDVLFVPDIETNLLSVRKATQNGCKVIFENDKCHLKYNGRTYLEGKIKNGLYEVNLDKSTMHEHANVIHDCNDRNCINTWHRRLGHRNYEAIKEIITKQLAVGITINNCKHETVCETCIKAKITEMPYPKTASHRGTRALQLIHTDICGPIQTPSIGGKTYFLTFIDDFSRYTVTYLLSHKSEMIIKLKEYIALVHNKFGRMPEALKSDNGGEYISHEVENFLKENGIKHQLIVPHCPPQNGTAERKNRTLMEMVRTLLSEANLPHKFWAEALNTATYLQNRLPTKSNDKTPYEMWTNYKPNLSHLKVFGCKAYAYIHKSKRGKLDDKAVEGIFVGYDNRSTGYRIYTGGKNITISRTVRFLETLPIKPELKHDEINSNENKTTYPQPQTISLEIDMSNTIDSETNTDDKTQIQPRRSQRTNLGVPPDRFIYVTRDNTIYEPSDWSDLQSLQNPIDKKNWLNATKEEMKSLKENDTWTLETPPQGKKVIGCKWLFKAKYDSTGNVQTYKARLVAKGFAQKYGEDYEETFAPVVSYTTIRTFLAAAAYKNLSVQHIDIKTAFLHGDLEEEVYMAQPEGYEVQGEQNKVCKLKKAIYGLKQAARAWNIKIGESLKKLNFVQSTADSCLYVKGEGDNTVYIIIYVDDILIAGKNKQIDEIIQCLNKEYKLKNLGEISYYLGMKIDKTNEGNYEINQKGKIEELLKNFNLQQSKPTYIPMDPGYIRLEDNESQLPNNTNYRKAIGTLLYIATVSRPDILTSVNILSRKNENPTEKDWSAVKRIIRYLGTTKDMKLEINTREPPILKGYADSDFASDKNSRKSTSGNVFYLGKNPIQWITKRQSCVALSTAEAEYISASNAAKEIIWLVKLLQDLNLRQETPIKLFEDNQSCIKMIKSEKYSFKTKHVDIKYHWIKELQKSGLIEMEYCPSESMVADIFTKPIHRQLFEHLRNNLQLITSARQLSKGE